MERGEEVAIGAVLLVDVEALSSNGEGIGRVDGVVLFLPFALPGERVEAEVVERKSHYARGRVLAIQKASPERVAAPCPYYGRCGGCQLMHVSYERQLQFKREKVKEALSRIGKLSGFTVGETIPSHRQFGYRNKIEVALSMSNATCALGFHKMRGEAVVDVASCSIHNEIGDSVYSSLRELLKGCRSDFLREIDEIAVKSSAATERVLVVVTTHGGRSEELLQLAKEIAMAIDRVEGVVWRRSYGDKRGRRREEWRTLEGNGELVEEMMGLKVSLSAAAFFQVNKGVAEQLYRYVADSLEVDSSSVVLDAYCGVGILSLYIARRVKCVIGIEVVGEAIESAKNNGRANGIDNCVFIRGKVEKAIANAAEEVNKGAIDRMILNPPRGGCDKRVLQAIIATPPKIILYISCEPATLARDLSQLSSHYSVEAVQPFDMFPQTAHVETVVKLLYRG